MLQSIFVVCCTNDMTGLCGVDSGSASNTADHGECSVSENGPGNFIENFITKQNCYQKQICGLGQCTYICGVL